MDSGITPKEQEELVRSAQEKFLKEAVLERHGDSTRDFLRKKLGGGKQNVYDRTCGGKRR